MTDKQSFLDKLSAALVERGVSDIDIAPYIERFDRFYDRMVSDSGATSRSLENVDKIADNIAAQISDRYDEMNRLAERTMTMDTVKLEPEEPAAVIPDAPADADTAYEEPDVSQVYGASAVTPAEKTDIYDQPTAEADIVEISEKAKSTEIAAVQPADAAEPLPAALIVPEMTGDAEHESDASPEGIRLPDYVEEKPLGDTRNFYIGFFATLPITAALALIGIALFASVWVALGAAIGALMVGLVAVAGAGAAVSLVGIVYGIIQLFDNVNVGIYEIGLGVLVAGVSMLSGILIYNIAIRLLPFVIRQVYRLFVFVIKKVKELFIYLRKECSKQ